MWQATLEQRIRRDIAINMGDCNVKIASENVSGGHVMRKEGLGQMNNNGEYLTPHGFLQITKQKNQIDHIIHCL